MKINPEKDGIDHINIYSRGATELGRLLSNFSANSIYTEQDGYFQSIEGYWYWLLSDKNKESERLRYTFGFKAKELGRKLKCNDWPNKEEKKEFQIKIKKAMKYKIDNNSNIKILLKNSTLPFKHYYCYGDKVVEVKNCKWILDYWEELRNE